MPCYYLPQIETEQKQYFITGEEFHHLSQVMRKRQGDNILVSSGSGILANCKITSIEPKRVLIEIVEKQILPRSQPQMALGFALLKNKHDSLIIEKATELGCAVFYPLETQRTVRRNSANQQQKFHKTGIAAMKQCDNAWLPEIKECHILSEIPAVMRQDGFIPVVALETERQRTLPEILAEFPEKPLGIIIGPEGGFSAEEIDFFVREEVMSFSLGNHILRAETAAISSLAQLAGLNFNLNRDYY
ncbi:MAG: 16S rRNA (uracil(1498)-N(3))-methyltransferase [Candidatus Cloacimonetes bacterium]|nr:16S rRNA (uracil(1498)-N(3))-methyltransferase [Candidatus Cloacimonadota bacterium]